MTRLLFVHDHRFLNDNAGGLYTVGSFPSSIWERYLVHFSSIRVFARSGGLKLGSSDLSSSNAQNVSFRLVPSLNVAERLGLWSGASIRALSKEIDQADAVIVRLPSDLGLLAAKLAADAGKPWFVEVVGCAWDAYSHQGTLAAKAYAPIAFARMRRVLARAPFAVYVTREWLQTRYPSSGQSAGISDVAVSPIGLEQREGREKRLEALFEGRRPILGTVASLSVAYKGIQTALAALAKLQAQGLSLEYRVLGAGDPRPWLQQAEALGVVNLVHFDGTRPTGDGVLQWLDSIDLYMQPSFQEGLPRALVEALSRGCAAIGSTAGGIPELLPKCRMHQPGDAASLAIIIDRLVGNPDEMLAAVRRDWPLSDGYADDTLSANRKQFLSLFHQAAQRR